jgi:ABC-type glycerol-3-phosphate transport system substrate-binding protein
LFNVSWDYAWGSYQAADSAVKDKVGMPPMPVFLGKAPVSVLGGWGLAINNYSQNKETAIAFVQFLSDPEQIRFLLAHTRQSYSNRKIMSEPAYTANNPVYTGALARDYAITVSRPVTPRLAEIVDAFNEYVMPAVYNKVSAKDALKAAANKTRSVTSD